ncbi:MAG: hypothetical protein ACRDCE_07850 [Cetobacterium sp.]|uniref:hypothetical protein n=1 Tax=Cetobacterium sp. TaxID=2071632 RepID=UPI003EE781E4
MFAYAIDSFVFARLSNRTVKRCDAMKVAHEMTRSVKSMIIASYKEVLKHALKRVYQLVRKAEKTITIVSMTSVGTTKPVKIDMNIEQIEIFTKQLLADHSETRCFAYSYEFNNDSRVVDLELMRKAKVKI